MDKGTPINGASSGRSVANPEESFDEKRARAACALAFEQITPRSIRQDLDLSWRGDTRLQPALLYVGNLYGDAPKRYGSDLMLTHVLWGADKVHTLWKKDPVLSKKGIDPALITFVHLFHDAIEEPRDMALIRGKPFDEKAVYDKLTSLWPVPSDAPFIRHGIQWMTDDFGLLRDERLDVQRAKSLNDRGQCIVGAPEQVWRFVDKLEQVTGDARLRMSFVREQAAHEAEGRLLSTAALRRLGVDDEDVMKCAVDARVKSYVLDFPDIPLADKRLYITAMTYLESEVDRVLADRPAPQPRAGAAQSYPPATRRKPGRTATDNTPK